MKDIDFIISKYLSIESSWRKYEVNGIVSARNCPVELVDETLSQ